MKIKKMRRLIREQLHGNSSNLQDALSMATEAQNYAQEAIQAGRDTDADAIVIFVATDVSIKIVLYAGRSLLLGHGIKEYLFNYHNQDLEQTKNCIEWLTDNAVDALKKEDNFFAVLRDDESDRWRGFRGDKPISLDEINAQVEEPQK